MKETCPIDAILNALLALIIVVFVLMFCGVGIMQGRQTQEVGYDMPTGRERASEFRQALFDGE